MAVACGRVVGITLSTAVVPALFTSGGLTEATPCALARLACMPLSSELVACCDCFGSLTTTVSGPFTPTPKPCEIRS